MSEESKINMRYQKLQEMQTCYENNKLTSKIRKILSISLIITAWIITIFVGFTTPFFFLHFMGTAIYLYNYLTDNILQNNKITISQYLFDPIVGLLLSITCLCALYTFLSIKNCSPY